MSPEGNRTVSLDELIYLDDTGPLHQVSYFKVPSPLLDKFNHLFSLLSPNTQNINY